MSSKYCALTLGPIHQTLLKARRTREAWAASYVFSWLMKQIMQHLHEQEGIPASDFILPAYPEAASVFVEKIGVGVWPDRLMLKTEADVYPALTRAVEAALDTLARLTYAEIVRPDKAAYLGKRFAYMPPSAPGEVLAHFVRYFRAAFFEIGADQLPAEGGASFVKRLNFLLDHLELSATVAPLEPDFVAYLLGAAHRSFLVNDAFHRRQFFESLIEVATGDLRLIDPGRFERLVAEDLADESEEQDLLDRLAGDAVLGSHLATYHRYVAIVHADGDRIGQLLDKLGDDPGAVQAFSADMLAFGREANRILAGDRHAASPSSYGHGAAPLYLGGDDLVFFAPVARRDPATEKVRTIFHLLAELDQAFDKQFAAYSVRPTLSFGVSISYYKYPLQEALEVSRHLLETVKQAPYDTRNRIHFRVLRHSGQHYSGIIDKGDDLLYNQWFAVLDAHLPKPRQNNRPAQAAILAGVAHKLDLMAPMLETVLKLDSHREARRDPTGSSLLDPLFANQFDEKVHRSEGQLHPFLVGVKDFIAISRLRNAKPDLDLTYALLRFIHFINSQEDA